MTAATTVAPGQVLATRIQASYRDQSRTGLTRCVDAGPRGDGPIRRPPLRAAVGRFDSERRQDTVDGEQLTAAVGIADRQHDVRQNGRPAAVKKCCVPA